MVSAEEDTPSEYQRGEGYVVSTWRNVLLMLWSGAVTIEALDATNRAGVMIEKRYAHVFSREERRAIEEVAERTKTGPSFSYTAEGT
jgi:hypothetical protein